MTSRPGPGALVGPPAAVRSAYAEKFSFAENFSLSGTATRLSSVRTADNGPHRPTSPTGRGSPTGSTAAQETDP